MYPSPFLQTLELEVVESMYFATKNITINFQELNFYKIRMNFLILDHTMALFGRKRSVILFNIFIYVTLQGNHTIYQYTSRLPIFRSLH